MTFSVFVSQSGEELPENERPSPQAAEVAKDRMLGIIADSDTTSIALTLDLTKLSQMEWPNGCM